MEKNLTNDYYIPGIITILKVMVFNIPGEKVDSHKQVFISICLFCLSSGSFYIQSLVFIKLNFIKSKVLCSSFCSYKGYCVSVNLG